MPAEGHQQLRILAFHENQKEEELFPRWAAWTWKILGAPIEDHRIFTGLSLEVRENIEIFEEKSPLEGNVGPEPNQMDHVRDVYKKTDIIAIGEAVRKVRNS